MAFLDQIAKNQDKLNESEQILLSSMLEYQETLSQYTIREIAGKYFVAPNMIIRMCKKLGFTGYTEFKNAYLEQLYPKAKSYPFPEPDIIQQLLRSRQLVNNQMMDLVVETLHTSNKITLFSSSLLQFIAADLGQRLHLSGHQVLSFSDSALKKQAAKHLANNDCIITFSVSGETQSSIEALQIARVKGAKIISVTGMSNNTISRIADFPIFVSCCEPLFFEDINLVDGLPFAYIASLIFHRYAERYFQTDKG